MVRITWGPKGLSRWLIISLSSKRITNGVFADYFTTGMYSWLSDENHSTGKFIGFPQLCVLADLVWVVCRFFLLSDPCLE